MNRSLVMSERYSALKSAPPTFTAEGGNYYNIENLPDDLTNMSSILHRTSCAIAKKIYFDRAWLLLRKTHLGLFKQKKG